MNYVKSLVLKNGMECTLRSATCEDAKAVLENFNLTHEETDYLASYPDENSLTLEQEIQFLKTNSESENMLELIAIIDGKVVGTAGIEPIGTKYKLKHRASFGISVSKEFWGLGIGKALTEVCIHCAKNAGYTQLELDVVAENTSAIALYKQLGFIEFGRNPKGFNSRISGFQELVYMRLEL